MRLTISKKDKLLNLTLDGLDEKYPSGLYDWLYKNKVEVYRQIFELEDRINDNFNTNGTVKELKAILRDYWIEHMKAISYFKECGQTD